MASKLIASLAVFVVYLLSHRYLANPNDDDISNKKLDEIIEPVRQEVSFILQKTKAAKRQNDVQRYINITRLQPQGRMKGNRVSNNKNEVSIQFQNFMDSTIEQTELNRNWLASFKKRFTRQINSKESCLGSCPDERHYFQRCHCDETCVIYNDCCLDYIDNIQHNIRQIKSIEREEKINALSCVTDGNNQHWLSNIGHHMVTSCPVLTQSKYELNCTNNAGINIPVTDDEGFTYRNVYCALCHGVTSYTGWVFSYNLHTCRNYVDIPTFQELQFLKKIEILNLNKCQVIYSPPSLFSKRNISYPRMCIQEDIYFSSSSNSLCRNYKNPILMTKIDTDVKSLIRNYHCLRQNFKNAHYECYFPKQITDDSIYKPGGKGVRLKPMTVMFQFGNDLQHGEKCFDAEYDNVVRLLSYI